jgi:hypothetical protein
MVSNELNRQNVVRLKSWQWYHSVRATCRNTIRANRGRVVDVSGVHREELTHSLPVPKDYWVSKQSQIPTQTCDRRDAALYISSQKLGSECDEGTMELVQRPNLSRDLVHRGP